MIQVQVLLIFMIIGAVIAVELKDLLGAIVAVGAVGLGLAAAFLFLQAPDLSIVQIVVEILALIILIRAVGLTEKSSVRKSNWVSPALALMFIAVLLVFAYKALLDIPGFGSPILKVSQRYLFQGLKETGAANLVSAIILDYRALDTLGEATILFTAVIGVLAVIRKIGRKK
ncbi:MAG: hypothetical protein AUJ85_03560 [Elusimicrobia bacterium CG1_02_37_114]|nr:MAG: hypothetical protein AUJ85_03560 [Elusimicrobia bacterium CG1_02_37_114]PIV52795.1 MAG: hypothetical protein COS17_07175 [Elusimicrobia bacterium CG02_land_8_20_14_3_00_37_13]